MSNKEYATYKSLVQQDKPTGGDSEILSQIDWMSHLIFYFMWPHYQILHRIFIHQAIEMIFVTQAIDKQVQIRGIGCTLFAPLDGLCY